MDSNSQVPVSGAVRKLSKRRVCATPAGTTLRHWGEPVAPEWQRCLQAIVNSGARNLRFLNKIYCEVAGHVKLLAVS